MQAVAVIPARGGSKGIARKNLQPVGGVPLVVNAILAAHGSRAIDQIFVSTEDAEIADVVRRTGKADVLMRPAELARDDTPTLPVLVHVLRVLEEGGSRPDILVLLQPTSPFRLAIHIDATVETLLADPKADGAVTVEQTPHRYSLGSQVIEHDGYMAKALPELAESLRRQDKVATYGRNGPAILALRAPYVRSCRSVYDGHLRIVPMPRVVGIDIDEPDDLAFAEALLLGGYAQLPETIGGKR